jgi:hypothetical protein
MGHCETLQEVLFKSPLGGFRGKKYEDLGARNKEDKR